MTTLSRLLRPYKRALARQALLLGLLWLAAPALPGSRAYAQLDPALAEDKFSDAFELYAQRLYEPALQAFAGFYSAFPDHVSAPDALYYQAEIALALGREEEAVRLFRTFQQRYPEHPLAFQARRARGQFFYETGN
jgi:tetratricopeptide (TPR) repeat protein